MLEVFLLLLLLLFLGGLIEGPVIVPKSKREGRWDRRKPAVLRTKLIPSG
jgi:hypothetical protein